MNRSEQYEVFGQYGRDIDGEPFPEKPEDPNAYEDLRDRLDALERERCEPDIVVEESK